MDEVNSAKQIDDDSVFLFELLEIVTRTKRPEKINDDEQRIQIRVRILDLGSWISHRHEILQFKSILNWD